jgi:hypothetical protein
VTSQAKFDWNRACRLKIIERAQLLPIPSRARLRAGVLLRVIESHCRESESCFLQVKTIQTEMRCSERTAQYAIADCRSAGLMTVESRPGRCSVFTLNWSLLVDLSRELIEEAVWTAMRRYHDQILASRHHNAGVQDVSSGGCKMRTKGVQDAHQRGARYAPINPTTEAQVNTGLETWSETGVLMRGQGTDAAASKQCPGRHHSFSKLTVAVLGNNQRLDDWIADALSQGLPCLTRSESDRLFVFASAERALHNPKVKNPVACFIALLSRKDLRKNVSCDDEDRASERLKDLANPHRRHPETRKRAAEAHESDWDPDLVLAQMERC